jgi:hypothetical protein
VRKRERKRKPSPSPLVTFPAGGKKGTQGESSRREGSKTSDTQSSDSCSLADSEYVVRENSAVEDDQLLSQEEAEKLMDEFLATFTSGDSNKPKNHET